MIFFDSKKNYFELLSEHAFKLNNDKLGFEYASVKFDYIIKKAEWKQLTNN